MKLTTTSTVVTDQLQQLMTLEWIPKCTIKQVTTQDLQSFCTPFLDIMEYFESLRNNIILVTDMAVFPNVPHYFYRGSHCFNLADSTNLIIACTTLSKIYLKLDLECQ